MRDQVFSYEGLMQDFKELVTNGPAFQFGSPDISRIRQEMKSLCHSLSQLYDNHK
jgi:hypothetical protein